MEAPDADADADATEFPVDLAAAVLVVDMFTLFGD